MTPPANGSSLTGERIPIQSILLVIDDSSESASTKASLDSAGIVYQLSYRPGLTFGCPRLTVVVDGSVLTFEGSTAIQHEFISNVRTALA